MRNRGFVLNATGWRLAPAFDVSPSSKREHVLSIDNIAKSRHFGRGGAGWRLGDAPAGLDTPQERFRRESGRRVWVKFRRHFRWCTQPVVVNIQLSQISEQDSSWMHQLGRHGRDRHDD